MKIDKSLVYPWRSQEKFRPKLLEFVGKNKIKTSEGILTDYSSLSFHSSFGFNNKTVLKSLANQISKSTLTFSRFEQEIQLECTQKLLKLLKLKGSIFFTNGGADSIEHALKICREYEKRKIILSRRKSYHGATLGALQITGDDRRDISFLPTDGHEWIPEPTDDPDFTDTLKIIKKIGPNKIAGICLESITAKNGVYILPNAWVEGLNYVQKKYGIKLIFDEVVCGFYRTLKPFGFQHYKIKPDFVCMGKAISNGMAPLGAVYISKLVMEKFNEREFISGHTNYAHPLPLAALQGTFKYTEQKSFRENL